MPSAGELAWRLRLPTPIHEAGKAALTGFGAATGSWRTLPDFLIIGAQRGGTTSLSRYLSRHPNVQSSMHKEIHYFDLNYARGESWYRGHFPTRAYRRLVSARRGISLTGEASPYYLFHPLAARRAAESVPDARLIVMLRDPVERAISHYHHSVRRGVETLPLEDALEAEPERLAGEEERIVERGNYDSEAHRFFSYVARGMYARQLRRWLELYERDRLLVLESGRFRSDPVAQFAVVQHFLGMPRYAIGDFRLHNAKATPAPEARVVERLRAIFREPNRELATLVGEDLGWDAPASDGQ